MATTYVSPTGGGAQDGSNLANAATLSNLDAMIVKAGAGGSVLLLADAGPYTVTDSISIRHGGEDGRPVIIRGVDSAGQPAPVEIFGSRAAVHRVDAAQGGDTFRLLAGADNLSFEHINFTNVGSAFRVCADVANLSIEQVGASNVRRFFEDAALAPNTSATVSGLALRGVDLNQFQAVGPDLLELRTVQIVSEPNDSHAVRCVQEVRLGPDLTARASRTRAARLSRPKTSVARAAARLERFKQPPRDACPPRKLKCGAGEATAGSSPAEPSASRYIFPYGCRVGAVEPSRC